jgi:hypothetical protein
MLIVEETMDGFPFRRPSKEGDPPRKDGIGIFVGRYNFGAFK